jgi:hydroxymethylpyrimidine pyrophosphatase-like HAD family hydrolase
MDADKSVDQLLETFVAESRFTESGGVVTDLDGTAVHEFEGRIVVPEPVVEGLKALRDRGRPLVLNTLRFPLSVINTFGHAWYDISSAPVPLVSMNGSQFGYLTRTAEGAVGFEEVDASPLAPGEIEQAIGSVRAMLADGIADILLFHYPRDWTAGEIIWTPAPEKIPHVQEKYRSASLVISEPTDKLHTRLLAREICMIFLLVEVPADRLMAYQHSRPSNFITASGTNKLAGSFAAAEHLGFSLDQSLGAGDTPMDSFLEGVGLAIHVGPMELPFRGRHGTIKVAGSLDLGRLLFRLAGLQGARANP